jgi:hypothetical protein
LLSPGRDLMVNVAGLLLNLRASNTLLEIALIAAAVAAAILAARREPWRLYPAAAAGALLSLPHVYAYDAAFLLPGLWAVAFRCGRKVTRGIAVALCTPLPYGLNLAGAPWAAVTPVLLLALLGCLAFEPLRSGPPAVDS